MKILFKYASRSRPTLFYRGLKSIFDNCTSDNYEILVSLDENDPFLNEYKKTFISPVAMYWEYGQSKSKIDAINRDLTNYNDWDILVNMSDDIVFTEKGFDDIIRKEFNCFYPEGNPYLDLCLHFPDGNRNDLITMSIMGRDYYNRFKYIYYPEYVSLYCDNEQTDVAKLLGCYKYVDKVIFNHLHPAYGKGIFDSQYQHTESFSNLDYQTYLRRKEINYGL